MRPELIAELRHRHEILLSATCAILCGDGWFNLLDCLLESIEIAPEHSQERIRIEEIKSKYGSLRIEWDGSSACASALVQMAEALSERTCETCGSPGALTEKGDWLTVACRTHA